MFKGVDTIAQIDPPTLDYVTINPNNGDVTVVWKPSTTSSVIAYIIREQKINTQGLPENYSIDTVYITEEPYSHTFQYEEALKHPVRFNIVALSINDITSLYKEPVHVSMYTSAVYDSCKSSIKVNWTPYIGWEGSLTGYSIFLIDGNNLITNVGEAASGVNQFSIPGIEENRQYCYYVSANRVGGGASSLSNKVCITTIAPLPPTYMVGDYTRYSGSNQVDLHFSIDPATVSDSYRLYRSDAASDNYILIADLNKSSDGTITYTDQLPSLKEYNYKLLYLNRCKAEGVSSIPINNILLKGKSQAMTNSLSWNSFDSWANGTDEVNIYRTTSQGSPELIATLLANETEYSDVISPESQMTGDICYQVKVVSNTDQLGKINVSESNIFCVNMLGEVFVPNAFTPNDDGRNDIFKPSFSILPMKYSFSIYNRYGAKIYETNNFSEGWDGRLSDGGKALEGAYIYYIRIENGAGKVVEKRGNFTVIYP